MDDDKQIDVLVMDFSKAFDKVSHNLLKHKLKYYNIRFVIYLPNVGRTFYRVHLLKNDDENNKMTSGNSF